MVSGVCHNYWYPHQRIEHKKKDTTFVVSFFSGGGGGSRTPVRERSAQGVYRFSSGTVSPRTSPLNRQLAVSPPYDLARAPVGTRVGQPDGFDTSATYQASVTPA